MTAAPTPVPADRPVDAATVQAALAGAPRLVVLDDDPTGTQTVRDLPVLTGWSADDVRWALEQDAPGCYVLTNTRALSPADAERVVREVAEQVLAIAADLGVRVVFASRSDSTLRGHFPLETDVLAEVVAAHGAPIDHLLVAPAYIDAGRTTAGGVHYAMQEGVPVPVAETEYAADATFGYRSSRLADWVAEKTGGQVPAEQVEELTLDRIRGGALGAGAFTAPVVSVDAETDDDLRAVAVAALDAEQHGSGMLYRVGPSFVRARVGQDASPRLDDRRLAAMVGGRTGGLVVVGSHVGLSTRQLTELRRRDDPAEVELDVAALEDPALRDASVRDAVDRLVAVMQAGLAVLSTSRRVTIGADADTSLAIARRVSAAVVEVVREATTRHRPAWVVAKGGITSAEVASRALGIRRAWVRGTVLPGVISVWEAVDGPAAGLPYVVFAGNVGDDRALVDVVDRLTAAEGAE